MSHFGKALWKGDSKDIFQKLHSIIILLYYCF